MRINCTTTVHYEVHLYHYMYWFLSVFNGHYMIIVRHTMNYIVEK